MQPKDRVNDLVRSSHQQVRDALSDSSFPIARIMRNFIDYESKDYVNTLATLRTLGAKKVSQETMDLLEALVAWKAFEKSPTVKGYERVKEHIEDPFTLLKPVVLDAVKKGDRERLQTWLPQVEKREQKALIDEGLQAVAGLASLFLETSKGDTIPALKQFVRRFLEDRRIAVGVCEALLVHKGGKKQRQKARHLANQLAKQHHLDLHLSAFKRHLASGDYGKASQSLDQINGRIKEAFDALVEWLEKGTFSKKLFLRFAKQPKLFDAYLAVAKKAVEKGLVRDIRELLMPCLLYCLEKRWLDKCDVLLPHISGGNVSLADENRLVALAKDDAGMCFLIRLYSTSSPKTQARFFARVAGWVKPNAAHLTPLLSALFDVGTKAQAKTVLANFNPEGIEGDHLLYWAGIIVKWGSDKDHARCRSLSELLVPFKSPAASKVLRALLHSGYEGRVQLLIQVLLLHVQEPLNFVAEMASHIAPIKCTDKELEIHREWVDHVFRSAKRNHPVLFNLKIVPAYFQSIFRLYSWHFDFILETMQVLEPAMRYSYTIALCEHHYSKIKSAKIGESRPAFFFNSKYLEATPEQKVDYSLAILEVLQRRQVDTVYRDAELIRLLSIRLQDAIPIADRLKGDEKRIFIEVEKTFLQLQHEVPRKVYRDNRFVTVFSGLWSAMIDGAEDGWLKRWADVAPSLKQLRARITQMSFNPTSDQARLALHCGMDQASVSLANLFLVTTNKNYWEYAYSIRRQFSVKTRYEGYLNNWHALQSNLLVRFGGDKKRAEYLFTECFLPVVMDRKPVKPYEEKWGELIDMIMTILNQLQSPKDKETLTRALNEAPGVPKRFKGEVALRFVRRDKFFS